MLRLPVEIIHDIAWALLPYGGHRLAPLATINRHWQGAIEDILWRHITITEADIDSFITFCQTRTRRQAVRHIVFEAKFFERPAEQWKSRAGEGYAKSVTGNIEPLEAEDRTVSGTGEENELSDTKSGCEEHQVGKDDAQHSLSTFQSEHDRFFHAVCRIWDTITCWSSCADVKSIKIVVDGYSMYEHLGLAFQHQDVVDTYLHAEDWLVGCPSLPMLPSVEAFKLDLKGNTDVDLWTAVAGLGTAARKAALIAPEGRALA
ncbi:hypothetical protein N0V95_000310 [Ascochyta clinopodiicola]|nr:hypothetical protein N0V95_000310 [Ascochyta clinopodiicola]